MTRFLIRNDDIAADTSLDSLKRFCDICDRHGFKIIQAITPYGECLKVHATMDNKEIKTPFVEIFRDNYSLVEYLRGRDDLIGVHGLWHTHAPLESEIHIAKDHLERLGFSPTYFVPPFNEGDYPDEVAGLKTCKLDMAKGERLEDFLKEGTPTAPIMYLHSWRFGKWYRWSDLDRCLERLCRP